MLHLQIDFSSLMDVRIVKHGNSDSSKAFDDLKAITDKVDNSAPTNTDGVSNSAKAGSNTVGIK